MLFQMKSYSCFVKERSINLEILYNNQILNSIEECERTALIFQTQDLEEAKTYFNSIKQVDSDSWYTNAIYLTESELNSPIEETLSNQRLIDYKIFPKA